MLDQKCQGPDHLREGFLKPTGTEEEPANRAFGVRYQPCGAGARCTGWRAVARTCPPQVPRCRRSGFRRSACRRFKCLCGLGLLMTAFVSLSSECLAHRTPSKLAVLSHSVDAAGHNPDCRSCCGIEGVNSSQGCGVTFFTIRDRAPRFLLGDCP